MTTLDDFSARLEERHACEVAEGLHDAECESRPRSRLCHCRKRRRIASGFTKPPGELIIQYPMCPRCYTEVSHDGDGFVCQACEVSWTDDLRCSDNGTFMDDYGDLSPRESGDPS